MKFLITTMVALSITRALTAPATFNHTKRPNQERAESQPDLMPIDADIGVCFSYADESSEDTKRIYKIHVGRDYAAGVGCGQVRENLGNQAAWIKVPFDDSSFRCDDDGHGRTFISFSTLDEDYALENTSWVLRALRGVYTMVTFRGGILCWAGPEDNSDPMGQAVKTRDGPIEPNTGMCANHLGSEGPGPEVYDIIIGRPYNDGAGCNAVFATLNSSLTAPGIHPSPTPTCDDDGSGSTHLWFQVNRDTVNGGKIDKALAIAYPDVKTWDNPCEDGMW